MTSKAIVSEAAAYDLGRRAGYAAKRGDWALVRHLTPDGNPTYTERAEYRRGYRSSRAGGRR